MRALGIPFTALMIGAALSSCSDREADIGIRRSVLQPFQSCEELETYLEDAALDQIGRSYYYYSGWGARGVEEGGALEGDADQGAPPEASGGLTGTNVQEAGVDESDFVKSDDQFIYVLHGQNLVILSAFPATEAHIISETKVEG